MPVQLPELDQRTEDAAAHPARVILYNDDWHTFDDVIIQLIKATGCSVEVAQAQAWTVHSEGRCQVFEGARAECERVAGVLREIRLQVEVDWDD